jgi:hypothetical protein
VSAATAANTVVSVALKGVMDVGTCTSLHALSASISLRELCQHAASLDMPCALISTT